MPALPSPIQRPRGRLSWRFTSVEGRRVHFVESSDSGDVTLLVLHGFGCTPRHANRRTTEKLAASAALRNNNCRMIAPVLPGFGKSERLPKRHFGFQDYGNWCLQFLEKLEVKPPVVILGESMGGAIAVTTATLDEEIPTSIALFNSAGGYLPGRKRFDWMMGIARLSLPSRGAFGQWISSIFDAVTLLRRPATAWRLAGLVVSADLRPTLRQLAQRAVPVVAVFSRRDPVVLRASAVAFHEELDIETLFIEGDHRSFIENHPAIELVLDNLLASARNGEPLEHDPARRISVDVRASSGLSITVDSTEDNSMGHSASS